MFPNRRRKILHQRRMIPTRSLSAKLSLRKRQSRAPLSSVGSSLAMISVKQYRHSFTQALCLERAMITRPLHRPMAVQPLVSGFDLGQGQALNCACGFYSGRRARTVSLHRCVFTSLDSSYGETTSYKVSLYRSCIDLCNSYSSTAKENLYKSRSTSKTVSELIVTTYSAFGRNQAQRNFES